MSNDPAVNIEEGNPNASMSARPAISGTVLRRSKNVAPDALVQAPSVSPKIPCTNTTATRLFVGCCTTHRDSVVLVPSSDQVLLDLGVHPDARTTATNHNETLKPQRKVRTSAISFVVNHPVSPAKPDSKDPSDPST